MSVSAIAAGGVSAAAAGFEQAVSRLSSAANPASPEGPDTVSLSEAAVAVTQQQLGYALAIKALKIANDIEKTSISIIG